MYRPASGSDCAEWAASENEQLRLVPSQKLEKFAGRTTESEPKAAYTVVGTSVSLATVSVARPALSSSRFRGDGAGWHEGKAREARKTSHTREPEAERAEDAERP
jgi:hypothetical protein